MLFISPPFGNYISLPYCKSIKGSYTLEPRPGLLKQIWNTLYYDSKMHGWVNKIGLRNKGLDYGIGQYNHDKDILSIAILKEDDIEKIVTKIPEKTNIEINISCPNINKKLVNTNLQKFLNKNREWCIIKCSPHITEKELNQYYQCGFRQFHFCNTLPVENGGLSGKTLTPYVQKLSKHMKEHYKDCVLINGGGIETIQDMKKYQYANHHSISTLLFRPIKFAHFYYHYIK
tara:strand:- start:677 stop:1369 length:693 start_codon:yes stop_codon:yes gene_type:complete